jgi:ArsR family transcriptional regulator
LRGRFSPGREVVLMKDLLGVTRALSDCNRIKIIKALQHRSMFVSELQPVLGIAQPTVSKHLRVLEEAGLVASHRQGTWVRYHITEGARNCYSATILGNLRHWLEKDPEIMKLYETLPLSRELRRRKKIT